MKKNQFEVMIRTIVKQVVSEEIRKQLPKLVSEIYLRKLVSEANSVPAQGSKDPLPGWKTLGTKEQVRRNKPLSLEHAFEEEMAKRRDDHVPEPMYNSDEGVYQQQNTITRKNESVRSKLLSSDNPWASMFEGVKPIERQAAGRQFVPSAENLPMIPPTEVDAEGTVVAGNPASYGEFFQKMMGKSKNNKPMQQSEAAQERRLEQQRAKLDEIKIG